VDAVTSTLINTWNAPDGGAVVEVRGDVDISCSDRLGQLLHDIAARQRPPSITVDLLHVTFIDSTGIGALAAGAQAARTLGIAFTVRNPSAFVATQLHTTGLYEVLTAGQ
jgi:anti-anti-sigma factor